MSVHFPFEFTRHINDPATKAAFFSQIEARHPRDCKNCGGIGTMIIFLAKDGPFINPPSGKGVIAKWADGHWWGGRNEGGICPDCKGTGVQPGFVEPPIRQRQLEIPDKSIPAKIKQEVDDYTNV